MSTEPKPLYPLAQNTTILWMAYPGEKRGNRKFRIVDEKSTPKDRKLAHVWFVYRTPANKTVILRKTGYCDEDTKEGAKSELILVEHPSLGQSEHTLQVEEVCVPSTRGMKATKIAKVFGWKLLKTYHPKKK